MGKSQGTDNTQSSEPFRIGLRYIFYRYGSDQLERNYLAEQTAGLTPLLVNSLHNTILIELSSHFVVNINSRRTCSQVFEEIARYDVDADVAKPFTSE